MCLATLLREFVVRCALGEEDGVESGAVSLGWEVVVHSTSGGERDTGDDRVDAEMEKSDSIGGTR